MATKDEMRHAILATAQSLFTRFGPVKTSVADIARELGMSPANIYNFYPSRDAILEAVGTQNLIALRHEITNELARTTGDWARIAVLFMSTARHMRDKLENEKDILQLQALATKNHWKFVEEFHLFLRQTAEIVLREAIDARRLNHENPKAAAEALFDCMTMALDPSLILKFTRENHFQRIAAQLNLLEKAFR